MKQGQIVLVKSGRDKGSFMAVVELKDGFVYLADGKRRRLQRPKKKNVSHVAATKGEVNLVPECGRGLQDADIAKAIRTFVLKEVTHIV